MTTPFTVENELLGMFPPKSDIGTPSRAWCMRAREYHIDLNEFPAKEEALGRSGAAGLSPSTSVLPAVLGGRRVRGREPRFGGL